MRLYNKKYDFEIELKENQTSHIIIENRVCFSDLVQDLYEQLDGREGNFFLQDANIGLPLSQNVDFIFNPFSLELNNKKILNKIYKELEENIQANYLPEMAKINAEILNLIDVLFESSSTSLVSDSDINLQNLFKLYNIRVNSISNSLVEKIIDYIRVSSDILGYKVFIFVNLNSFLDEDALNGLCEFCEYRELYLVNFSGSDYKIKREHSKLIIDESLCHISI